MISKFLNSNNTVNRSASKVEEVIALHKIGIQWVGINWTNREGANFCIDFAQLSSNMQGSTCPQLALPDMALVETCYLRYFPLVNEIQLFSVFSKGLWAHFRLSLENQKIGSLFKLCWVINGPEPLETEPYCFLWVSSDPMVFIGCWLDLSGKHLHLWPLHRLKILTAQSRREEYDLFMVSLYKCLRNGVW